MELTRKQQQFVLDALAQVISRRYTDAEIKFVLKPEGENTSAA